MTTELTADAFLQLLTQATYFVVFLLVAREAVRRPRRANVDTALFFGAIALIVAWQWANAALRLPPTPIISVLSGGLFMALPYIMLRLVDDFTDVPRLFMRGAAAGLVICVLILIGIAQWSAADPRRVLPTLALVVYFVALSSYCAYKFVREAGRSSGVTQRRMQAVAAGAILLGALIVLVLVPLVAPALREPSVLVSRMVGLASGVAFALGFAPPRLLRRAWQEPELRAFLGRAASLPRLATTEDIVHELRRGAASATGAPSSTVGLLDRVHGRMRYFSDDGEIVADPQDYIAGRAFTSQQAQFVENAPAEDPENAEVYARFGARTVLAAPITAGDQRLGVLTVYAPRPPIFADDDLMLVQLLADQAAVILESRALIDEAARVRAREEATRLRDDFLSSAAHDLKTPLTTMLAQAQLLERKTRRNPEAPADAAGISRMVAETRRLNTLVLELLDASRAEQGALTSARERADLAEIARVVCARYMSERHPCRLDAPEPVEALVDRTRIEQLLGNLVENAIKYSPEGGAVELRVWGESGRAFMDVADHGIGIPPGDLPRVFDRFYRGRNVDDKQFAGMGLGLFICRAIVEEHGGTITVTSTLGSGTTFHVALPAARQAEERGDRGGVPSQSRMD